MSKGRPYRQFAHGAPCASFRIGGEFDPVNRIAAEERRKDAARRKEKAAKLREQAKAIAALRSRAGTPTHK